MINKSLYDFVSKKAIDVFLVVGCLKDESLCHYVQSKDIATYSHAVKILNFYIRKGFITIEKIGRENKYTYTAKGKVVYNSFLNLKETLISEGLWNVKKEVSR
jgi:predicted MarR family transcription regulator